MRIISAAALVSAALVSFAPVGASAQTDVGAVCLATPAQCETVLLAEINRLKALGLTGSALDSQISVLVSSIFVAAQSTTDDAVERAMGAAIRTAASEISDQQAAAGVRQAAAVVNSGRASQTVPDAFGLAPNSNAGTPNTGGQDGSGN